MSRKTCHSRYTRAATHARYNPRPPPRSDRTCQLSVARYAIRAPSDPTPPPRGDKAPSYDTREPRSTRYMIRNRHLAAIKLPATIHASCNPRALWSKTASPGRLTRQLFYTRATPRATYYLKPPPRGDKHAIYFSRGLHSARPMIRNCLLGAQNLPAMIHAIYDPRAP